jgi:hypothetical protein
MILSKIPTADSISLYIFQNPAIDSVKIKVAYLRGNFDAGYFATTLDFVRQSQPS